MPRTRPLSLEILEDRCVPATWGNAWPFAQALTLSFAPDGTQVGDHRSELFQMLNSQFDGDSQAWQLEILRAFETWATQTTINIGVVADDGEAFGGPGNVQFNPGFGDIRIAAYPMSPEVIAFAVPYEVTAGTWAGKVFLNSSYVFGSSGGVNGLDLFSVMLHESGHVFGLSHSEDPNSPMFEDDNTITSLIPEDIQRIQALYGVRAPDEFEGAAGNETATTATPIVFKNTCSGNDCQGRNGDHHKWHHEAETASGHRPHHKKPDKHHTGHKKTGKSPSAHPRHRSDSSGPTFAKEAQAIEATVNADITTAGDVDWYQFQPPSNTNGVTVQLRTSGLSLLQPGLSVYDASGKLIDAVFSSSPLAQDLSIGLKKANPAATYYVKVESAGDDVFNVGRYELQIDALSSTPGSSAHSGKSDKHGKGEAAHSGKADRHEHEEAAHSGKGKHEHGGAPFSHDDQPTNNSFRTATEPKPFDKQTGHVGYTAVGTIRKADDVQYYRIRAPGVNSGANVMRIMVSQMMRDCWTTDVATTQLEPDVQIFDASERPVSAELLVNESGSLTLQVTNPAPNATYYVRVRAAHPQGKNNVGSYFLNVAFPSQPEVLSTLVRGVLDGSSQQASYTVEVEESRLLHVVLSSPVTSNPAAVQLRIYDSSGNALLNLAISGGEAQSRNVYLPAGIYTVRITTDVPAGAAQLSYDVRGQVLSDPIGPHVEDVTSDPVVVAAVVSRDNEQPTQRAEGVALLSVHVAYSDPWWDGAHQQPQSTLIAGQAEAPPPQEIAPVASVVISLRGSDTTWEAQSPWDNDQIDSSEPRVVPVSPALVPSDLPAAKTLEATPAVAYRAETGGLSVSTTNRPPARAGSPASAGEPTRIGTDSRQFTEHQANKESLVANEAAQEPGPSLFRGILALAQLSVCVPMQWAFWTKEPSARARARQTGCGRETTNG